MNIPSIIYAPYFLHVYTLVCLLTKGFNMHTPTTIFLDMPNTNLFCTSILWAILSIRLHFIKVTTLMNRCIITLYIEAPPIDM